MTPRPVTVLTGYLGAGKTTLVNHVLRGGQGRYAVIVNEYGEVGIDGALIDSGAEELVELSNGCLCCTVRGDLLRALHGLVPRLDGIDGVLIELSGLADPAPVVQGFLMDDSLRPRLRLDGVVAVADARHLPGHLEREVEAQDQIAYADLIVLNKIDLAGDTPLELLLRQVNPFARIVTAVRGRVPVADLFGQGTLDLDRIAGQISLAHGGHSHGPTGIQTVTLRATEPLDGQRLGDWIADLLARQGQDILRGKGILSIAGEERMLALHAVHMILEGDYIGAWPSGPRDSRLVLIGRHLDAEALRQGFRSCLAAKEGAFP